MENSIEMDDLGVQSRKPPYICSLRLGISYPPDTLPQPLSKSSHMALDHRRRTQRGLRSLLIMETLVKRAGELVDGCGDSHSKSQKTWKINIIKYT
jgi:hypothetical protein